jgi:site-specific recombinase XerD
MLRHDFATKSYNLGYTDLMLKFELGHSSNATNIYTHAGQESLLELSNKR